MACAHSSTDEAFSQTVDALKTLRVDEMKSQ